jgi:hypothetical protein
MFWGSTIENSKTIPLSFLKKKGLLKPNTYTKGFIVTFWNRGEKTGTISLDVCTLPDSEFVRFYYTIGDEKKDIDYKVKLIRKSSNLGKGFRYYFECPYSKKLCTILVKPHNQHYFFHRTVFKVLYEKQAYSKQYRLLGDIFYFMSSELEDHRKRTYAKRRKMTYKGKVTKHVAQFEKTYERKDNKSMPLMISYVEDFEAKTKGKIM